MRIKIFLLISTCLGVLVLLPHAAGHGSIARTEPADGSRLSVAPPQLSIWFNEPLVPNTAKIQVVTGSGETLSLPAVYHSDTEDTLIIAEMPAKLEADIYVVTAAAVVVSDGHESTGSFSFWIETPPTTRPA